MILFHLLAICRAFVIRSCNLRDSHENTSAAAESADQVAGNRESTDTSTTKGGGSRDDTLELTVHGLVTVSSHHETLLLQLLGDIPRARTRDFDPSLGESGASKKHVSHENRRVNRVEKGVLDVERWAHVVNQAADRKNLSAALTSLPHTNHLNQKVLGQPVVEHLRNKEHVRGESRLEHDGHVRGVEETDGVGPAHAALAGRLDGDLNTETFNLCQKCLNLILVVLQTYLGGI